MKSSAAALENTEVIPQNVKHRVIHFHLEVYSRGKCTHPHTHTEQVLDVHCSIAHSPN